MEQISFGRNHAALNSSTDSEESNRGSRRNLARRGLSQNLLYEEAKNAFTSLEVESDSESHHIEP